ncbi:hypothetical protein [Alkalihalobacillus sp. AL-G]|uniref:hypothetical protein n=1 Tax=Alkalihalobacillus sp. AL-G TaxID=2926399 RepID=UPI00272BC754|nr:hypothetical protein [Alkalihalobacillus sp. AL-G]WLD93295.1 hypothetical protein MOJ78_20250 [Alkalihalobacillus sp. AL-G]
MAPNIKFNNFTIDHVSSSSGVFSGDNLQQNFSYQARKNEGNGTVNGNHNLIYNNKHVVTKTKPEQDRS